MQPVHLFGTSEVRVSRFGQREVVAQMGIPHRRRFASFDQLLRAKLADGFQHSVVRAIGASPIELDQRVIDQSNHTVRGARAAHRFGRFQRPATAEHGQRARQIALRVAQEVVAPVDGRAQ